MPQTGKGLFQSKHEKKIMPRRTAIDEHLPNSPITHETFERNHGLRNTDLTPSIKHHERKPRRTNINLLKFYKKMGIKHRRRFKPSDIFVDNKPHNEYEHIESFDIPQNDIRLPSDLSSDDSSISDDDIFLSRFSSSNDSLNGKGLNTEKMPNRLAPRNNIHLKYALPFGIYGTNVGGALDRRIQTHPINLRYPLSFGIYSGLNKNNI